MERKIDETFEYEGKKLKVTEDRVDTCEACFFHGHCTMGNKALAGKCGSNDRDDGKNVIFVEVQEQHDEKINERKVGEVFEFEGHKIKAVDADGRNCPKCFLYSLDCSSIRDVIGFCSKEKRTDKKNLIFVEAKDEQPQGLIEPQKLNLCEILKDCPNGELFWSPLLGDVKLYDIDEEAKTVVVTTKDLATWEINADGTITIDDITSELIMLYPSRKRWDWSKVKYEPKKERFDPKTLNAFDKVLARLDSKGIWCCELFSFIEDNTNLIKCCGAYYKHCIPFNEETKHLVGTTDEAPEYYRYWED